MKETRSIPMLKDIAEVVGVSIMTVSNVLRSTKAPRRALYSEETARRVWEAANKMGYAPNRIARAMRTKSTGIVGFVTVNFSKQKGTVENFVTHPFMIGLNHALSSAGKHVALVEVDELELRQNNRLPAILKEHFFDGLVVQFGLSSEALHVLEQSGIPLIYWDSGLFEKENCLFRDERKVMRLLAERLLDLGHRNIAFMAGREVWNDYREGRLVHYSFPARYEEFAATMQEHGLKPRVILGYDPRQIAAQLEKEEITGLLVQNALLDYLPTLRAATFLGKSIPEHLSILACDVEGSLLDRGTDLGGGIYNRYEAGRMAATLLLRRLKEPGIVIPSLSLPIEVSDGLSVAQLKSP